MEKTESNNELDAFLINYLVEKNNNLGTTAHSIWHWNKNLSQPKIIGRLKALSNKGIIIMKKKPYRNFEEELCFVNIYFPKEIQSKKERCDAIHEDTQGLIRKDLLLP